MLKILILTISTIFFLLSCSNEITNKKDENLKRMDQVFGPCDNPHRNYSKIEKSICKDKLRATGPDGEIGEPIDIFGMISGGNNKKFYATTSMVNKNLWDGSLIVFESYPLSIIDYEGGVLETNWIIEDNNPNQRCLLRSHITSAELISTGVNVKIICEKKIDDNWFYSNEKFINEEKTLTIKILEEAAILSQTK